MSFNLSEGAIEAIVSGNQYDNPVFQVISSKLITLGSGADRYRLLLSDGRHSYSHVMLATELNPMIQNGEMDTNCLIRCKQYVCTAQPGDRRVLILLAVNVLANGWYIESRIGNPRPYTHGPVADRAPAQSAPNNSAAINTSLIVQADKAVTMDQVSKCRDFLCMVIVSSHRRSRNQVIIVTALVQALINGKLEPELFLEKLHEQLKLLQQPNLVQVLKKYLPLLREEMFKSNMSIPGVVPPPLRMIRRQPVHQVSHTVTGSQSNQHTTTCASSSTTSSTASATSCASSSAGTTRTSIRVGSSLPPPQKEEKAIKLQMNTSMPAANQHTTTCASSATSSTASATSCASSSAGKTSIRVSSSLTPPQKEEKAIELPMNTSMPAVSSHNLHEHLMCAICLELYTEPVRLSCMHCFCRKCITDHTVKGVNIISSCPECNCTILTKEIGSLKTDFKLKELVSAIRDKPLCSDHDAQDERIAELICKTCHVTLCTKCAFGGQHMGHVLDDLQTALHKYHSEMSTKMPNIKEKLDGYKTQITEVQRYGTELQDIHDSTETEFNRLIEDLQDKVLKIKTEGLEEISDSFNMVKKELAKKEATLSTNIRNAEKFMKCHSSVNTDPANSIKNMANVDGYLENDPVDIEEPDHVAILDNCSSLTTHLRQLKHMVESCQQFMQPSHTGANTGKCPAKRKTDATSSTTRTFHVPGKRVKLDETIGAKDLTENEPDQSPSGRGDHKENGPVSKKLIQSSGRGDHKENGPFSKKLIQSSGRGDHKENGPFSAKHSQEGSNSSVISPSTGLAKLTARFVKVGTHHRPPVGPIIISERGLYFCIQGMTDKPFNILPHEIKQCLIGNIQHRDITLIFLLTTHNSGECMLRDPVKPPARPDVITIVTEKLSEHNRSEFLRYMKLIKLQIKEADDRFIIELSSKGAVEMLRKSNVQDYTSVATTSKASDDDQQ